MQLCKHESNIYAMKPSPMTFQRQ